MSLEHSNVLLNIETMEALRGVTSVYKMREVLSKGAA